MITSIYCAIIALILLVLSINVIKDRRRFGAGLGDANNIEMIRPIRAQSNLTEYSPIFIILLGFAEYGNLPDALVHLFGIVFIAGRVMHAYSLLKFEQYDSAGKLMKNPVWRIRGMICTFSSIATLAVIVLIQNLFLQF